MGFGLFSPCESWVVSHKITQWTLSTFLWTLRLAVIDTHLSTRWQLLSELLWKASPASQYSPHAEDRARKELSQAQNLLYFVSQWCANAERKIKPEKKSQTSPGFCSLMHELIYSEVWGQVHCLVVSIWPARPFDFIVSIK